MTVRLPVSNSCPQTRRHAARTQNTNNDQTREMLTRKRRVEIVNQELPLIRHSETIACKRNKKNSIVDMELCCKKAKK